MGNCLIAKLKETVNSELRKLGTVRVYYNPITEDVKVDCYANENKPWSMKIYDYVEGLIKEVTIKKTSVTQVHFTMPNGGYIELFNKYDIRSFQYLPTRVDASKQDNADAWSYVSFPAQGLDSMYNWGRYGLGLANGLAQSGDILDYVRARKEKNVLVGSVYFNCYYSNGYPPRVCTFNGKTLQISTTWGQYQNMLCWDNDKVWRLYGHGAQWVDYYGFTDEEIAELTAEGGDWEGYVLNKID